MRALSETEAAHFLRVVAGSKHYALFATLIGTGLRPGEAFGLQWSDIDENTHMLRVQRAVMVSQAGWSFQTPKTARSRRHVTLPPSLTQLLLKHRREQTGPNSHNLMFPSDTGTPLNLRNLTQRYFKEVLKAAGLPPQLRLYDLRHTHATLLLSQNEHPKIVSERLGHATITLTLDTYSHVLPGMQSASARKLDAVLFQAAPEELSVKSIMTTWTPPQTVVQSPGRTLMEHVFGERYSTDAARRQIGEGFDAGIFRRFEAAVPVSRRSTSVRL